MAETSGTVAELDTKSDEALATAENPQDEVSPSPPDGDTSESDSEADEEAQFLRLAAEHDMLEEDEKPAPIADAEPDKQAKQQDESEQPKQDTDKGETSQQEAPEGFDEALEALVLDGMPESQIENLWRNSPEEFIEYGIKRAGVQLDQQQYISKLQGDEGEDSEQETSERPDDEGEKLGQDDSLSANEAIDKAITRFREDDLLEDVADDLSSLVTAVRQEAQAEVSGRDDMIDHLRGVVVNMQIENARTRAEGNHPQLKEDSVWDEVLERYDKLSESGEYETVTSAIDDAIEWTSGTQSVDTMKDQMLTRTKSRRESRPAVRGTQPPQDRGDLSPEEQERQIFLKLKHAEDGA